MRNRQCPVWKLWDPLSRFTLQALSKHALILPIVKTTGQSPAFGTASDGASGGQTIWQHVFGDGDFRPTSIFVEELRNQISEEIETLWDRTDISLYPSNSEEWYHQIIALRNGLPSAAHDSLGAPEIGNENSSKNEWDEAGPVDDANDDINFQRKFQPEALRETANRKTNPLICVASLVVKTPNLAGLTRTSEIFSTEKLVVPNAKITSDTLFQSISVSAERWMPVSEVKPVNLPAFLREKKSAGYAIVGVEQTQNSVPLQDFVFPENAVLVLGAEKEGIDAELLPLMDVCVEIPQSGHTRSLNVHVSGSICIWEYVRQRLTKHKKVSRPALTPTASR